MILRKVIPEEKMAENNQEKAQKTVIAASQFDSASLGEIKNSVNMYRGEVNLPLPLIRLPGTRGLDINLQAFYSSAVGMSISTWNLSASTGLLGVGWSWPEDKIAVDRKGTGTGFDDSFFLLSGDAVPLYRTGATETDGLTVIHFQAQSMPYWQISYFTNPQDRTQERWEILKEDGKTYVYGLQGIEWGVSWRNWIGSTTNPSGEQYPVAWKLVEMRDYWGNAVHFEYAHDNIAIGEGAAKYTRASRLKQITDTVGRTVKFHYLDKSNDEIQLPYQTPEGQGEAFQFFYQTQYLDVIQVMDDQDRLLFTTHFDYMLGNVSMHPNDPHYCKRYLTGVRQVYADGSSAPGFTFEYYTAAADANPGALKRVTYPKGGAVTYHFDEVDLGGASTRAIISSPGSDYTPTVWHGPDYVIVAWYNSPLNIAKLTIYSWRGNWRVWQTHEISKVCLEDMSIIPGQNFFAFSFKDISTGRYRLLLYRANQYCDGEWLAAKEVQLGSEYTSLAIAAGNDFIAVRSKDSTRLLIEQWDVKSQQWQETRIPSRNYSQVALTAMENVCLAAYYDDNDASSRVTFQLYYSDANRVWRTGDQQIINTRVDWSLTSPGSFWSIGPSFASATYITESNDELVTYETTLLQWRENFTFTQAAIYDGQQDRSVVNPILYSIADATQVGHAQNCYRFTGERWDNGTIAFPQAGNSYRYAYGMDLVVAAEQSGQSVHYSSLKYDPYQRKWSPGEIKGSTPTQDGGLQPTILNGYCLAGRDIYYEDSSLKWLKIYTLPNDADLATLQNRAPFFISYQKRNSANTHILFLKDGAVQRGPEPLAPGERIYVENPQPGQILAGARSFVTYKETTLENASKLFLYRVLDETVQTLHALPVISHLTIDSGFGILDTTYTYDLESATCDPSGTVVQFSKVRSTQGNGYTDVTYFNSLGPDRDGAIYPPTDAFTNVREYFSLVAGTIYQSQSFDENGCLTAATTNFLYAYDKDATGNYLFGACVRQRKTESLAGADLFDLAAAFREDFDQWTISQRIHDTFAAKGMPLSDRSTVELVKAGSSWNLDDPINRNRYSVVATPEGLTVRGVIKSVAENEFNAKNQVAQSISYNTNSEGQQEKLVQTIQYAWEIDAYKELETLNCLSQITANTSRNATQNLTIAVQVVTFKKSWNGGVTGWAPHKTYAWNGEGSPEFDFAAWSGSGTPPNNWVLHTELIAITTNGQSLVTADIDGIRSSVLFDRQNRFPVASFGNADCLQGEANYYGFEEYEAPRGWALDPPELDSSAFINTGDSCTGSRRLMLTGNSTQKTGLRNTFQPATGNQKYILVCRVKTPEDFTGSAGWEVTASDDITTPKTRFFAFATTRGAWRRFHCIVDAATFGIATLKQVDVFVFNQADGTVVLVDNVAFQPFSGTCDATVYDSMWRRPTAQLNSMGVVSHIAYDTLQHPVATITGNQPKTLSAQFLWRQAMAAPDPALPNSDVTVSARSGGSYDDFHHGDEWETRWQASPGWSLLESQLVYSGVGPGALTLKNSSDWKNFGIRLRLSTTAPVTQPIGLQVGDRIIVRWNAANWEIYDIGLGRVVSSIAAPVMAATDWMLIACEHSVVFFADGRQVLQYLFSQPVGGTPEFFTSSPIALQYLIVCVDPVVQMAYSDGSGNHLQSQSLDDGAVIASATCYDSVGRAAIITKAARFDGVLPGYRTELVTGIDWTSGILTGEVAEAYPDDEGYPYSRHVFENAPTSRVVETGSPGKVLGIDLRTPVEQRHTALSRFYTNSTEAPLTDLPPNEYAIEQTIDPDKLPSATCRDKRGNIVAAWIGQPGGDSSNFNLTRNHYDAYGNLVRTELPNYFQTDLDHHENFYTEQRFDFFGRVIQRDEPESRPYAYCYVYDKAGRIRFSQDPNGAKAGYLLYARYDFIGRVTEAGWCPASEPWDTLRTQLQDHADDKTWLPSQGNWLKRYAYDGDGADLDQIGQLVVAETADSSIPATTGVMEQFEYNESGRLKTKILRVNAFARNQPFATRFTYDNLDNPKTIASATGTPGGDFFLQWDYDQLNRLQEVRTAEATMVRYRYDAQGGLLSETFLPDDAQSLERKYTYKSAGMLAQISDRYFSETLEYFGDGYNGAASYAGRIVKASYRFTGFAAQDGFAADYVNRYAYSPLKRLQTADCSAGAQWSMGVGLPLTYDANGNNQTFGKGSTPGGFTYASGTNKLVNSTGEMSEDYTHDTQGNITSSTPRGIVQIDYDRLTQLATRMQLADGKSIDYVYDAGGGKVYREENGIKRLYLPGANGRPSVEIVDDGSGSFTATGHLIGPTGLFGMMTNRQPLFLIKDHLNSTRAIFDGNGIRAAYNYDPTGAFLGTPHEPAGRLTVYLYTGQEFEASLGLYNYRARFFDPSIGRFYSLDPAGEFASPYLYAGGDWINFNDPTGMFSWAAFGAILGGIAAFGGGFILAVITAGAAAPVVVLGLVGGGAMSGAGMVSVVYGFTHTKDGSFNIAEWGAMVGVGAVLGAITGGFFCLSDLSTVATLSGETAMGSLGLCPAPAVPSIARSIFGVLRQEGFIGASLLVASGGVFALGLPDACINSNCLDINGINTIGIGLICKQHRVSHTIICFNDTGYEQTKTIGENGKSSTYMGECYFENANQEAVPFNKTRARCIDLKISQEMFDRGYAALMAKIGGEDLGHYNLLRNSCTSNAVDILRAMGFTVNPLIRAPWQLHLLWRFMRYLQLRKFRKD